MSEKHKNEIDQLLSDLVDGQATERQETEFKRLAQHDRAIIDQVEGLRRQKQLLNALPVESAPVSMAEDIRQALERKLILGDYPETGQSIVGTGHLYLRRILTAAAMLLLPLGLLSFVVYEIMKPASVGPGVYVSANQTLQQQDQDRSASAAPSVAMELPFDGVLTFETSQQMVVSNYIEKMIFDQGLSSFPNRTANTATYQITASPSQIAGLINSLDNVWSHCHDVTLSIMDGFTSYTIEVPSVQAEQIVSLAAASNRQTLNHLAGQFATANENKITLYAQKESSDSQDIDIDAYPPRLRMPILTGTSEPVLRPTVPDQPTVQLRIHVKGLGQ